jgi:curved DNA-binding protein CbpA
MKRERRNYYRVLHVQPEAPAEIITASYRSMMTKLRHHPDLGGDHDTAVVINEAYSVLSDPQKRFAYDRAQLASRARPVRHGSATRNAAARPRQPNAKKQCAFCSAAMPAIIDSDTRCSRCDCPLAPVANRMNGRRESIGRRASMRVNKSDYATIRPGYGKPSSTARLRDLSPTGLSLFTAASVATGTIVRVVSREIDLVARVVKVRSNDGIQILHARLLTANFASQLGVFVSITV